MSKQNAFLAAVEAEVKRRTAGITNTSIQMALDAAIIAANEVFNMGESRCKAFTEAFSAALNDISDMTIEDGKIDKELWYSKGKLDQRLKQICGEHFIPWDERYK